MSLVVLGRRLVASKSVVQDGWVEVELDRIVATGSGRPPPAATLVTGAVVVPGFVDLHVHGGGGASFDTGDPDDARTAVAFHRSHGTTSMMASLVTAPLGRLRDTVAAHADLVRSGLLLGLHLEGPWLSPRSAGAHDPSLLRPPDPAELRSLVAAGGGAVRVVTLAPEAGQGLDAVRAGRDGGVVMAVGHTDASYEQTRAALRAGASLGTHLFNAMRPLHHRDPGPVPALLEAEHATVELIADGIHLDPAVVRLVLAHAGADRICLVTDAIAAAGRPDGAYRLGALDVDVSEGVARLRQRETIAGSTLTMDAAFRFAVRQCGASLQQAVAMTSSTPAAVLDRSDIGALAVGRRADLVVLDHDLRVQQVLTAGRLVDRGSEPVIT